MSELKFECPHCGQHLATPPQPVGVWITCPSCQQSLQTPAGGQPVAQAAEGVHANPDPARALPRGRQRMPVGVHVAWALAFLGAMTLYFLEHRRASVPSPGGGIDVTAAGKAATAPIEPSTAPSSPRDLQGAGDRAWFLPPAVERAIKAQAGARAVASFDRVVEDGETFFEVELSGDATPHSFTVTEDGQVVRSEVLESDLPPAVRQILRTEFSTGRLGEINRELQEEEVLFTTEVTLGGRTNLLTLAENGSWWGLELELAEAPPSVRQTVTRLWGTVEAADVTKLSQAGEISYEVQGDQQGRVRTLTLSADGRLLDREEEQSLDQVPAVVRNAVRGQVGNGEVVWISKATHDDLVSYQVEATSGGQTLEFAVDTTGKILAVDN